MPGHWTALDCAESSHYQQRNPFSGTVGEGRENRVQSSLQLPGALEDPMSEATGTTRRINWVIRSMHDARQRRAQVGNRTVESVRSPRFFFFFFLAALRLWDPKRAQQGPGSPRSARTIKTEQNPWCRASAATGEGHRVLGWKSL